MSGMLTPLRSERWSPTSTVVTTRALVALVTRRRTRPSSSSSRWPDFEGGKDFRVGQFHPRRVAGVGIGIEDEGLAERQVDGLFGEHADAQLRPLQVDEDADRVVFLGLHLADGRRQLAHELVIAMAHIDAEDIRTGPEKLGDRRPVGRGRTEGGKDLGPPCTPHVSRWFPAGRARSAGPSSSSVRRCRLRRIPSSRSHAPRNPQCRGS